MGVLVGALVVVGLIFAFNGKVGLSTTDEPGLPPTGGIIPSAAACPDTLRTAVTFDVQNPENKTGVEEYDATGYVFDDAGKIVAVISDTTNPSATNLKCGTEYQFKLVATDGASGDNSRIEKVIGPGSVSDGVLNFKAEGSDMAFQLYNSQQATIEAKVYSNIDSGYLCNGDDSCLDYELDGVALQSTVNGTVYNEANGIDVTYKIRAVESDTNWNDFGTYVMLELPTNVWDTPTVWVDGQKLTDMKAQLNADESKAWSGYEYVYFFDQPILDGGEGVDVRVAVDLAAGVASATADPEVDFSARGAYLSTDGASVKRGAVMDDSTQTIVRTVFDSTIDVTA